MDGRGSVFSRRELLRLSGGLASVGAFPSALFAQNRSALSDAHVHLFNLSDLPVAGFVQFVFLPAWAQSLPLLARSLARTVLLGRRLAVSADEELRNLAGSEAVPRPAEFAEQLSEEIARATELPSARRTAIVERLARTDQPRPAADLQESYLALALALQSSESERGAEAAQQLLASPGSTSAYEEVVNVEPELLARVAAGDADRQGASELALAAPDEVDRLFAPAAGRSRGRCSDETPVQANGHWSERLRSSLKWAGDMTRSRQAQLDAYLAQMAPAGARPLLVNLLVDYDRWLSDRPAPASSHDKQIALWTRLADGNRARADIRTFAGFDPLKHAEDRLLGDDSYWRRLQAAFRNGQSSAAVGSRLYGFKLYPPMGFRPGGNVAEDFRTNDEALALIHRRWSGPALRGKQLHEELNRSLTDFFAFCAREGAPVLAHASHSNDAGHCWGSRANPRHWLQVVQAHPQLRLCLGHFAEASDFNAGMSAIAEGQPAHSRIWALHGLAELLRLNRDAGAHVYADIGYMSELLIEPPGAGARLAVQFFRRLGEYCDRHDPRCEHLMFGSDWVMLSREVNNERYLETVRFGIDRAGWSDERRDNFLVNNLRRFLDLR